MYSCLPNESRRCLISGAITTVATLQSSSVRLIILSSKIVFSGLHQGSIEHRKPRGTSGSALVIHRLPSMVTLRKPASAPTPLNRRLKSRRRTMDSPRSSIAFSAMSMIISSQRAASRLWTDTAVTAVRASSVVNVIAYSAYKCPRLVVMCR